MNAKLSEVFALFKQIVASFLSVVLLVNMSVPALAQSLPDKYKFKTDEYEKKFEQQYRKAVERAFVSESTNTTTPAMLQQKKYIEDYKLFEY